MGFLSEDHRDRRRAEQPVLLDIPSCSCQKRMPCSSERGHVRCLRADHESTPRRGMSKDPARAASQFFGGRVCLDFANTLDWRLTASPVDLIPDYSALLAWSERRGTLPAQAIARLRKHPSESAGAYGVMRDALVLRAEIWSVVDELIAGRPPRLSALNDRLAELPCQPDLRARGDRYVFGLDGSNLRQPLWPVLWSLTAVLTSADASRMGSCQAKGCGWYFIDESANRSRTWCSSEVCGNRERVRRAYARRRSVSAPVEPLRRARARR
jgi:predicted RNA-binding Zn ribbon-like protein